jgi:hypothetical protein
MGDDFRKAALEPTFGATNLEDTKGTVKLSSRAFVDRSGRDGFGA